MEKSVLETNSEALMKPECELDSVVPDALKNVCCFSLEEDKNQNESKNCVENDINTDPWPGYRYTGKLHPHYPLVSCVFTVLTVFNV